MKVTVLFSGGIDSLACAVWANQKYGRGVELLYFNIGSRYTYAEIDTQKRLIANPLFARNNWWVGNLHQMVKESADSHHVPMRNAVFLMKAALLGTDKVVFGMLRGEAVEDKTPAFVRRMQRLFRSQGITTVIETPFARYTKTGLVRWLLQQGVSETLIRATYGCHAGTKCGMCLACINRWIAFTSCGLAPEDTLVNPAIAYMTKLVERDYHDVRLLDWRSRLAALYPFVERLWCLHKYCRATYHHSLPRHLNQIKHASKTI